MPRPKQCRRIHSYPDFWIFSPEDSDSVETLLFMLDEFETIRLIDYCGMTQEECAKKMGVSRATIANIYESARFKLADAFVNGKQIRITGGAYCIYGQKSAAEITKKGDNIMRIAVAYERETVEQHFGRTKKFKLYDITKKEIQNSKIIDTNGAGHGALASFLNAADVDTLICGGIGAGARIALKEAGINLLPGIAGNVDKVIKDYLAGNLDFNSDETCHNHEGNHNCNHERNHNCNHENGCDPHHN